MPDDITVLIADDHPIFRGGVCSLMHSEPGFKLAGEAVDGEEAAALTRKLKPDVLLLDLAMPKLSGLEVLRQLADPPVTTRIILITASIEDAQVTEALCLGARGVIMKDAAAELLFKSIRAVLAGEFWVGRGNVSSLVHALKISRTQTENPVKKFSLSAREMEVLEAIVEGCSNKEIAERFGISKQTVKHHVSNIFDKLGVSNRLELALFSVNHQLLNKRS